MNTPQITLAENILRLRKEQGMTQATLATRLGITAQAVSKWESGRSAPDIELLPRLAEILSCDIDALFTPAE